MQWNRLDELSSGGSKEDRYVPGQPATIETQNPPVSGETVHSELCLRIGPLPRGGRTLTDFVVDQPVRPGEEFSSVSVPRLKEDSVCICNNAIIIEGPEAIPYPTA